MKYLMLILLFPFISNAGSLELGLGFNAPNAVNESSGLNYKLGYNYDIIRSGLDLGTSLSYEHYNQIAQTLDIKAKMTSVEADVAKLGLYITEEVAALAEIRYEMGVSYLSLSQSTITPTGGKLYGAFYNLGLLLSNNSIKTKFSYTLDYAKNQSNDLGVNTILMHSFKIGVLFEL